MVLHQFSICYYWDAVVADSLTGVIPLLKSAMCVWSLNLVSNTTVNIVIPLLKYANCDSNMSNLYQYPD